MRERKYKIEGGCLVNRSTNIPVPDDEPVFIFRAKDRKALAILVAYQAICDDLEQRAQVANPDVSGEDFRLFQMNHPELMKEPTP